MRTKLLASLLILAALPVRSEVPQFGELPSGPWPQDVRNRIESSVVRIQLNAQENNHCTATFIDNQGTALTALHCLRTCLMVNQNWNASNRGLSPVDLTLIPLQAPQNMSCADISVAGRPDLNNPQVLFTGWGLVSYTDSFVNRYPELLAQLKAKGWSAKDADFAILKFKNANTTCLKVSKEKLGPSTSDLWLTGFPMIDNLPPATIKVSAGKVYPSVTDSAFYKKRNGPSFVELYEHPGVLISSAPNQFGFSGSPSLNKEGEIIAVNSSMLISDHKQGEQTVEIRETQSIEIDFVMNQYRTMGFSDPVCNP